MGFAIPASIARDVLEQALSRGEVRRGWLGLSVLPVGRLGRETGALVSSILPGSSAERAGVLPGDILTAIDRSPVTARFFEEIPLVYQRLAHLEVGSEIQLTIERGGRSQDFPVVVKLMPKFKGDEWEVAEFGVTVQEITAPMAISRSFEDLDGLLLTGVRPGSPADGARPRLAPYDVLISLDGKEISSPTDLRRGLAAMKPGDRAVLEIRRDEERLATLIPAPSESKGSWGGELPKAWVGLKTQVLNEELSTHLDLDGTTGFRVTQVLPWTEAEKADFRVGDVIIGVDGEPLNPTRSQESEDLRRLIEERYIDDTAVFSILRDGQERTLSVRLEPRPRDADEASSATQEELDFKVRDVTFADRIRQEWDRSQQGVIVTEAMLGGWAQMAGLRLQDLILSINGESIADVAGFERSIDALVKTRPELIEIFLERGYRTHFVFIEPDWEELHPPSPEPGADS
jgi:serine protease Do